MLDGNELRALIRDVIAAELAAVKAERGAQASASAPAEHRVRIDSDADLAAFAKQVLALAGDPSAQKKITAGTYGFRLEAAQHAAPSPRAPASPSSGSSRIEKGVVTESALAKLPRGSRLEIGAEVSVTPLARDKARNLGITIERMKP